MSAPHHQPPTPDPTAPDETLLDDARERAAGIVDELLALLGDDLDHEEVFAWAIALSELSGRVGMLAFGDLQIPTYLRDRLELVCAEHRDMGVEAGRRLLGDRAGLTPDERRASNDD